MKLVIDSAPIGSSYSVIVNKLAPAHIKSLNQGNNKSIIEEAINNSLPGTISIYYNNRVDAIEGEDNATHTLPTSLAMFIVSAPIVSIRKEQVKPVKDNEYDDIKNTFGKIIQELRDDNKKLTIALEENNKKMDQIRRENEEQNRQLRNEHNETMRKMTEDQARALKKAQKAGENRAKAVDIPQSNIISTPTSTQVPQQVITTPSSNPSSNPSRSNVIRDLTGYILPGLGPMIYDGVVSIFNS